MSQPSNSLDESIDTTPGSVDLCLLLTATVDPEGMAFTERNNPKVRLEDYKQGLRFWLQVEGVNKVVFCENSNYDLNELRKVEKSCNPQKKQVEFLSFYGQSFPKHLGKGYGELNIISHAMGYSKLINHETKIIKATGRYVIKNVNELIDFTKLNFRADIICDLSRSLTWSDSRLFACSADFIKEFLLPMQERIDDSKDVPLEMVLALSAHRAMSEDYSWMMPPCLPEISGVLGSTDVAYKRFFLKDLLRKIVYILKRYFFALSN